MGISHFLSSHFAQRFQFISSLQQILDPQGFGSVTASLPFGGSQVGPLVTPEREREFRAMLPRKGLDCKAMARRVLST